jgi:hypothetical protein
MEFNLKISGLLLIILALLHIGFPKYFDWKTELKSLTLLTRQVMYVHTFFIALVVLLMGVLCFTSAAELIVSKLGNKFLIGFGFFWFCRLLIQLFGYSSKLWKGKKLETSIHILFLFLWTYLSVLYLYLGIIMY